MNAFRAILISLFFMLPLAVFVQTSHAATLVGDLPTQRANDEALPVSAIANVKIYRVGTAAPIATITQFVNGKFTYAVPDCTSATYTATATDTGNLESVQSNSASVIPMAVRCAPKSPTGITVLGG